MKCARKQENPHFTLKSIGFRDVHAKIVCPTEHCRKYGREKKTAAKFCNIAIECTIALFVKYNIQFMADKSLIEIIHCWKH